MSASQGRTKIPKAALKAAEPVPGYFGAFLVGRLGVRNGYKVVRFMHDWAIARADVGRPITAADYSRWWNVSEATTSRALAEFRRVWPTANDKTPERLLQMMYDDADAAALSVIEQRKVARWFGV